MSKLNIRIDSQGDGHFGAPRGYRPHYGVDYEWQADAVVPAFLPGLVNRVVFPYADDKRFRGLEIINDHFILWQLYVDPLEGILHRRVDRGEIIGAAQDLSLRYGPSMTNHIHVQVYINPQTLFGG